MPKTTEENNTKYEEDVNKIITLGTGMKRPSQYKNYPHQHQSSFVLLQKKIPCHKDRGNL